MVSNNFELKNEIKIIQIFKILVETDHVLQNVAYWPKISNLPYFKSKLRFQIQHSLFRLGKPSE